MTFQKTSGQLRAGLILGAGLALAGCDGGFQMPELDFDLRSRDDGFTTAAAARAVDDRPAPDDRGVISYPNYQVVVARRGDTVGSIAQRIGFDTNLLASYNGIDPNAELRRDEIVTLPSRVAEPSPATGAPVTGPVQPQPAVAVTELASAAIDRAETAAPQTVTPGTEPIRHQVVAGETAWSISRRYGVPVQTIADWNGLGAEPQVRIGQFLLIPQGGSGAPPATQPVAAVQPGTGSIAPEPPSAATPLPEPSPATQPVAAPATDLSAEQTPAPEGRLARPVEGTIIRDYAAGRNDGIDFGAPAGAEVRAADGGTVAAVTTDTSGVQIVVIRHQGGLLTVYTHLDNLRVERGSIVARGQAIGQVRAGNPSFLHFEVREGMESRDPTGYLGG